jgi:hypothetical protein
LQGIEPNSIAETTSALLDVDTSHTKFNRESKMVPGVFKPLAKVSKLRIGKDLGLTEVSLGTKVIGYAVAAGVMRKLSGHKYSVFKRLGVEQKEPRCGSQVSSSLYLSIHI